MPIPADHRAEAPKTAKKRVYDALKDWIIDGILQPGEKISDSEIAEHFSVSRTPVREAFQMLAEQKLIEVFPGKESIVSPIDVKQSEENYRLLADLHGDALLFAFDKITPEDIDKLIEYNKKLQESAEKEDINNILKYDYLFHRIFVSLADNSFLEKFTDTLTFQVTRVERLFFKKYPIENVIADHEDIISAVSSGNKDMAFTKIRENWLHTLSIIKNEITL